MRIDRIFIVGTGAVGSALAGLLMAASDTEVVVVGRSVHWQKIKAEGLVFETVYLGRDRVKPMTMAPEEPPQPGPADLILLTGKLPDLPETASWLSPKVGPDTVLIALQNGLGIQEEVGAIFKRPVERGLLFFGANCPRPGLVVYNRGLIRLKTSPSAEALTKILTPAPIKPILVDDFQEVEWFKLAINCVANPLAGILEAHNEAIRNPVLDPAKEAILKEVVAVAGAAGVKLDLNVDFYNDKIKGSNIPSLRADLLRKRMTEIDYINGAVVKKGRELGVPTPVNELIVSFVKYLEGRGREA